MYACLQVHACACTHAHARTHTHTHKQTNMHGSRTDWLQAGQVSRDCAHSSTTPVLDNRIYPFWLPIVWLKCMAVWWHANVEAQTPHSHEYVSWPFWIFWVVWSPNSSLSWTCILASFDSSSGLKPKQLILVNLCSDQFWFFECFVAVPVTGTAEELWDRSHPSGARDIFKAQCWQCSSVRSKHWHGKAATRCGQYGRHCVWPCQGFSHNSRTVSEGMSDYDTCKTE